MKSFDQFICEQERSFYHDWGLIHPSGEIISGAKIPGLIQHVDLKRHIMKQRREKKETGPPLHHYAEYLDEKQSPGTINRPPIKGGMYLRTNEHSIHAALKGLKKLPSSTGQYHLDHDTEKEITSGPEIKVRNKIKQLIADNND